MSILIKGMDMPKSCEDCPCAYFTEGAYSDECQVTHKHITDEKPTDCPLIEIPTPHGRLIDGDKLLKGYKQWLESVPYINNTMSEMGQRIVLIDICHDLEYSAPTILEAEE